MSDRAGLTRYAWLSIAAAITTITLKVAAWALTGSVGLLSDALESGVNLAAALAALGALSIAARPADDAHAHGYDKAEYFSSGVEGAMILVAALAIAVTALPRLWAPAPIEAAALGLGVSVVASLINFGAARVLLAAGKRHGSIALEADAHHLMTDVWTSVGVLVAVGLVAVTGWERLDPLIALAVAANIVVAGVSLLRRSAVGLLDPSLPPDDLAKVTAVLDAAKAKHGLDWHALRTRSTPSRRYVAVHVLVPAEWTVKRAHDLADDLEGELAALWPNTSVATHVEPLGDPKALDDRG